MNETKLPKTLRVLVVDDSTLIRAMLRYALPEWGGYAVSTAADGPTAMKMIESLMFDIVLLDLELPGMGGLAVSKAVRSLPGEIFKELVILGLTAHKKEHVRDICTAAGMNGVLGKPFSRDDFEKELSAYGVWMLFGTAAESRLDV